MHRHPAATLAALALPAVPAMAETSRSFEVSAQIVAGCAVATDAAGRWGNVDLGTVAGIAGTSAAASLVSAVGAGLSIECTPGVSASLTADAGDHPANGERRLMRAGSSGAIRYRLLVTDAATVWTTGAVPLSFAGGARLVPIRAIATLDAPMAAGTYTDTIRVTLGW